MAELDFKTEKLKLEALAKIGLVKGFEQFSKRFNKPPEAKKLFSTLQYFQLL